MGLGHADASSVVGHSPLERSRSGAIQSGQKTYPGRAEGPYVPAARAPILMAWVTDGASQGVGHEGGVQTHAF
jgi:hypothetical protein